MSNRLMRIFRGLVVALAILNIWFQALIWMPQQWNRTDQNRDMAIYYVAATRVGHGVHPKSGGPAELRQRLSVGVPFVGGDGRGDRSLPPSSAGLYHIPTQAYGPDAAPQWYIYPPYLACALSGFSGHYSLFSRCWYLLMIACFWCYAYLLTRLTLGRSSFFGTLVWGLVLGATPATYRVMSLGNVDPILWALFAAAIAYGGSQLVFAVMAMMKPYAAVPWLLYTLARGIRTAWSSVIVVTICTIVTAAVGGLTPFVEWFRYAVPLIDQGSLDPMNWSLSFAVLRILRDLNLWHYGHGALAAGPRLYLAIASVAGPVVTWWFSRNLAVRERAILLFFAVVLFSPLCWYSYLILAYVPVALVLKHLGASGLMFRSAISQTLSRRRP